MSYNFSGPFTSQSSEIVERTHRKLRKMSRAINRKPSLEYFRFFGRNTKVHLTKFDPKLYEGVFLGYSQTSKAYIVLNKETMRIEESLNVTFDERLPEPKLSPSVEDDMTHEPIVQDLNGSPLQVNVSEEGYPKSLKEARGHPIEQVIGELNERTLRSKSKQA
uniref:Retrovirus-related Pol polyprotein from transposon TNT 1-94 n=1 Tax=Tanacetum cinerariifolium TaxID=118510 RepID=A0A699GKU9_TANCI|nr:retrovirus-related Pol polyprotein from transposon TNT 1-94 [Tanacetum cinerariifolium]